MARKAKLSADERLENRFKLLCDGDPDPNPNPDLPWPDISQIDIRLWCELNEFGLPPTRELPRLMSYAPCQHIMRPVRESLVDDDNFARLAQLTLLL